MLSPCPIRYLIPLSFVPISFGSLKFLNGHDFLILSTSSRYGVINKNFSYVIHKDTEFMGQNEKVQKIIEIFLSELKNRGLSEQESKITLFMIIELVGSVCYSSIILNEPDDIEVIKPILFKKIRMILNS